MKLKTISAEFEIEGEIVSVLVILRDGFNDSDIVIPRFQLCSDGIAYTPTTVKSEYIK